MSTITTRVTPRSPRLHLAARIAAAVFGGYAFAWGFIAICASLMFAGGMDFHDAEFLGSLLGVLAFLTAFLWTFAARRLWLVWRPTPDGELQALLAEGEGEHITLTPLTGDASRWEAVLCQGARGDSWFTVKSV